MRDSGVCHALLDIATMDELLGHPVIGGSWEGYVIDNMISDLPRRASYEYYRKTCGRTGSFSFFDRVGIL